MSYVFQNRPVTFDRLNPMLLRPATKFAPRSAIAFKLAYDAGFRHAEFYLDQELIEDWGSIVGDANDFPMGYAMHFPNRGEFSKGHLRNVIDLYHAVESSALVIHQPMFDRYGEQLLKIDPDLRLGIENHDLTNDAKFERWADESPFLTLDVEHMWIYTVKDRSLKRLMNYLDWFLDEYSEKLVHVHLPGYLPGFKVHRPQYCSRKMVMQVWTKLANVDFEGLIVSETNNKYQNPEELQMDMLLYRNWEKRYIDRTLDPEEAAELRAEKVSSS